MEKRRIPNLLWMKNSKHTKFTFSFGFLSYYLINGLQYLIINNITIHYKAFCLYFTGPKIFYWHNSAVTW